MNGHSTTTPEFVQQFDEVPAFWQYLQGLSPDDLITELVQNELDALSTHTRIVLHPDNLLCEGNETLSTPTVGGGSPSFVGQVIGHLENATSSV